MLNNMVLVTFFFWGCTAGKSQESGWETGTINAAPTTELQSPLSGDAVRGTFGVTGEASDPDDLASDLQVRLTPDPAGGSGKGAWQAVNPNGSFVFILPPQPVGLGLLILEVMDPDGEIGSDEALIVVEDEDAPLPGIQTPAYGDVLLESTLLQMAVTIQDDLSGPWNLSWTLENGTDSPNLGCDGSSSSSSLCSWVTTLGTWTLTVTAEDVNGLVGRDHVIFSVVDADQYDDDGDGLTETAGDCDDQDGSVGLASRISYLDEDDDGYGAGDMVLLCNASRDYSDRNDDCDDDDVTIHPGGTELCDGLDNDCNGLIDENAVDTRTLYVDADGDGEGAGTALQGCWTVGYSTNGVDCDDTSSSIYAGAPEFCDGVDHDCDGQVNEPDSVDTIPLYADRDGDSYGDPSAIFSACTESDGYVTNDLDCDDAYADISPVSAEVCNQLDDNCDGTTDESTATDALIFYQDTDGDGYGDPAATVPGCSPPAGTVTNASDCDDIDASIHPGAAENCDTIDSNCDGLLDTDIAPFWYTDTDGDRYGANGVQSCVQPVGTQSQGGDCDDNNPNLHPGVAEQCDGVDEDCDGTVDNNATNASTWYRDMDGDGYGDPANKHADCTQPIGFVSNNQDCNDSTSSCYPGAVETCDLLDNDCNGTVDDVSTMSTYYKDQDRDGYGLTSTTQKACSAPIGYANNGGDCDDANARINPGAREVCDGIDNDCDGAIDPVGAASSPAWYQDADADGHGNPSVVQYACTASAGYVASGDDCNDASASSYPGATEYCDGVDHDCDGTTNDTDAADAGIWYEDRDGDGYGNASAAQRQCQQPTGTTSDSNDCNDADASIKPSALEVCDTMDIDENCNGLADDADSGVHNQVSYYQDADNDGYGDSGAQKKSCSTPAGYVTVSGDCNDANSSESPGLVEICDTLDNDCDGTVNDDMEDAYEPNETVSTGYSWSSSQLKSASKALTFTFQAASDTDTFLWTTEDQLYVRKLEGVENFVDTSREP